jgi:hypothetical protein
VKLDLSPVDVGEEVAPDHGEHHASEREHQRGDERNDQPGLSSIVSTRT